MPSDVLERSSDLHNGIIYLSCQNVHIRCVVIVCIHQIYFCLNKKRVSKDPVLGIINQKQTSGWCSNWVQYTHKRQSGRLWRYLCYGADPTRNSQQKYALLIPPMMHVWCHTIKCRGTFGESKDRSIVLKNWNKENTNDEHQTSYDLVFVNGFNSRLPKIQSRCKMCLWFGEGATN